MKKKYLLIIGCCFLWQLGKAQPDSLSRYHFQSIISLGNQGLLSLMVDNKDSPSRIHIRHVSNEDSIIADKKINLNRRGVRGQLEDVFYWQGKINVLSSLYYPGPKRNNLLFTQYSLEGLKEVGIKKIDEAYTPDHYRIPFGYSVSPDSSKIAFYSWSYAIPGDPARLTVHVLNEKLNLIWQNYYLLPYKNETLYLYGCQIDNEGKFYLFCEDYKGKVGQYTSINEKKIKRFVLLMEGQNDGIRVYPLEVPDRLITDIRFQLDQENNLIAAGFFRPTNKRVQEGLFVFKIDGKSHQINRKLVTISKDIYFQAYLSKERTHRFNPPKSAFQDYTVDHLNIKKDGTLFLIGEQQPYMGNYSTPPTFGDILVIKLTSSHTLDWLTRIPKKQMGWQESIFSYAYFEKNNKLFFFFNDAAINTVYQKDPTAIKVFTGSEPANVLVRVSDDGVHARRNISKLIAPKIDLWVYPSFCWPLETKLIFYCEKAQNVISNGAFFEIDWQIFGVGED